MSQNRCWGRGEHDFLAKVLPDLLGEQHVDQLVGCLPLFALAGEVKEPGKLSSAGADGGEFSELFVDVVGSLAGTSRGRSPQSCSRPWP
jgi:hypothetical protein